LATAIDIWRIARELVRWRGTKAPQYVAQRGGVVAKDAVTGVAEHGQ
jgi:hypothetical protein